MLDVVLAVIGGLVLFLFAIKNLSDSIQETLSQNAEKWILKFTSNAFSSVIKGTLVTALLDSSSAVIIITIVLVNAKLLSFRQSLGIVLGANIGTTISSQIIALDVGRFSPVLLLIGFVMMIAAKSASINKIGKIVLYFGVLFFGLFSMENATEPLKDNPSFAEWLAHTDHPLPGAIIGGIVTLIIQSSSATVGMAIILAKKGFSHPQWWYCSYVRSRIGYMQRYLISNNQWFQSST